MNLPVTAAAAAMEGLTRWVRPPGPWRPSKLRLLVLAAALAGLKPVGVHRQAHAATRLAPLGAGLGEDAVQPLGLGLVPHLLASRHDQRAHALGDLASLEDPGRGAQVLDAAVGARADEDDVHRDLVDGRARLQPHVFERAPGVVTRGEREARPARARGRSHRRSRPGSCPR